MQSDVDAAHGSLPPLPAPERIQELLFDAARLGRTDMISALLLAGADIEARDPKGYTPLILASYHGHLGATALLLDEEASIDQPDRSRGNTALMGAAFKGYEPITDLLLRRGADPNAPNHAGQTALMMASLFGRQEIVDRLITYGADKGVVDTAGNSALSLARDQGNSKMVALLESGP
nr:ankyrin repeat domain-containing protein [Novosphingobium panipatense]